MKLLLPRIIFFSFALYGPLTGYSQTSGTDPEAEFDSSQLTFSILENTEKHSVELVAMPFPDKYTGDVVIPATTEIDGVVYDVVGIAANAFAEAGLVTSVEMPASLQYIGDTAFRKASGLKSVILPESVTSVGEGCFQNCSSLETVSLPAGLEALAPYIFSGCTSLTNISLPEGLTEFPAYSFYNCPSLEAISFPSSINKIGECAFSFSGVKLGDTWPEKLSYIGNAAFRNCANIVKLALPASIAAVGDSAFANCSGLETADLSMVDATFGESVFSGCSSLSKVMLEIIDLPSGLKVIGDRAFDNCRSLTVSTLPAMLVTVGDHAFSFCNIAQELRINSNSISFGQGAFENATGLELLILQGSIELGENAFAGNINLGKVEFGGSSIYADAGVFHNCPNLMTIYSLSNVPPIICATTFDTTAYENAALYVPVGNRNIYNLSSYWQLFKHIGETTSFPSGVNDPTGVTEILMQTSFGAIIYGENMPVRVYTIDGAEVDNFTVNGQYSLDLDPGIYIVVAGDKSFRICTSK